MATYGGTGKTHLPRHGGSKSRHSRERGNPDRAAIDTRTGFRLALRLARMTSRKAIFMEQRKERDLD